MNQKNSKVCDRCRKPSVRDIRRTRFYKGVVIENIPATYCRSCGEELYDLATVQAIEQILANPEDHTTMVELPVARIGEDGEPMIVDEIYEHVRGSKTAHSKKDSR